jgi:hypothetical protein
MDERDRRWERRFPWPMVAAALLTRFVADRFINRQREAAEDEVRGEILHELRAISARLDRLEPALRLSSGCRQWLRWRPIHDG